MLDKSRVDRRFQPVDDVVLKVAGEPLKVSVSEQVEGEITHYAIRASGPAGTLHREWAFAVDREMFGGGFVKALDLDGDGRPEVLAWDVRQSNEAFVLQSRDGAILETRGKEIPPEVVELADNWYHTHVQRPIGLAFTLVLLVFYYLLAAVILLIARAIGRSRAEASKAAEGRDASVAAE